MNTRTMQKDMITLISSMDLSDGNQRFIHDEIIRTHTGRWPLWKTLDVRQLGSVIIEAARWRPRHKNRSATYGVIRWDLQQLSVSWSESKSRADALAEVCSLMDTNRNHVTDDR